MAYKKYCIWCGSGEHKSEDCQFFRRRVKDKSVEDLAWGKKLPSAEELVEE